MNYTKKLIDNFKKFSPKGPGFELKIFDGFSPISKTDARVVQVIHTSALFGMQAQAGTLDFYPNGGSHQPGLWPVFFNRYFLIIILFVFSKVVNL